MEWKDIIGFEGLYQANSKGQIKSLSKIIPHWKGGTRIIKEKILTGSLDKDGYRIVNLSYNHTKKLYKVHRIIAECFIDNPLNKKTVNHINAIKSDNSADNLEWNTHRENTAHRSSLKDKTSKYSNIHFCKTANKWIAQIQNGNKKKMIGAFDSEEIAHNNLIEYTNKYGIK